jgi:protein TonB
MFEQSQLEVSAQGKGQPTSMFVGFALQALMLAGALMASLFFTEAVPRLRFDASLMAPPRAKRNFIPIQQPDVPRRVVTVKFRPRPSGLVMPPAIPRETLILDKPQAVEPEPPEAYIAGAILEDGSSTSNRSGFLGFENGSRDVPEPPEPTTTPTRQPVVEQTTPTRIGGDVAAAMLIHRVQPSYPPLARQVRIQGTVRLEAIISEGGEIANLRLISGHPMLVQASLDAVAQWRYRPTMLNGRPVAVITTVDVNFILGNR